MRFELDLLVPLFPYAREFIVRTENSIWAESRIFLRQTWTPPWNLRHQNSEITVEEKNILVIFYQIGAYDKAEKHQRRLGTLIHTSYILVRKFNTYC